MKGYKVTNASRSKICGIAASRLGELKTKAATKFKVKDVNKYRLILLDGTLVDNEQYFQSIPPQTLFILARKDEEVSSGADIIYNALRAINIDYLRAGENIKKFFEENIKEKLRVLTEELMKHDPSHDKTHISNREDHVEWFEGLNTNCTTKEDFLRLGCRNRISGYYYKACSVLRKSCDSSEERTIIDDFLLKLKEKLSVNGYHGGYFDRRDKFKICDDTGLFTCGGVWNKERCLYVEQKAHVINPYRSREDRIVFSTWNLDHQIEKSRTIIPCILEATRSILLKESKSFDFNYDKIYSLLFTSDNLRIVHIVCHDKGAHTTAKLQPENIVISLANGFKNVHHA